MTRYRIAAAQVAPVFLDRDATIEKACRSVAEAGKNEARLLVFPETFVPGYPCWTWVVPPKENRMLAELYAVLGESDKALDWLNRDVRFGDERAEWMQRDPLLKNIRENPRFKQIVESITYRREQRKK